MSLDPSQWPDVLRIVEEKVKPKRANLRGYSVAERRRDYWWQYGTYTPALYRAIANAKGVLAISQTTAHICFAFLPTDMVFSQKLIVLPVNYGHREFSILQSRIHAAWAILWGSTQGDTPVYSPPECFETFPFPCRWQENSLLQEVGATYYAYRADLMIGSNQGLTRIYNRFHDPDEKGAPIQKLRDLHLALDRAVLDAYGWQDVPISIQFFDERESDGEDDGSTGRYRFTWPVEIRDEVLARLLALNAERVELEQSSDVKTGAKKTTRRKGKALTGQPKLL